MIGKEYFVRQAVTLLKLAQTTTNPEVAAGLVDKAAELKSKMDEAITVPDLSPSSAERPTA